MSEEDLKLKKTLKKGYKRYIVSFIVIVLATVCGYVMYNASCFQITDDAYIENHTVRVAPKVSGQIVEVYVQDNQKVKEGDLIAKIDDTDYKIALDQATAQYEKALLQQNVANANLKATQTQIDTAKADLERYQTLYAKGAVSKQQLDIAQAKYDSVQASMVHADQSVFSKDSNSKVADADLKTLKAMKDRASMNLSYTKIYAPQSGTITSKNVEKGSYVQVGSPLVVVVPEEVWVVANYKENQIGGMKVGQEVEIKVDAYKSTVFKGKIDSIQRASGAKSSLFPPENAVGSFVKIVQRIPVKIVFTENIDTNKYTLVPGMSVVPKVRVK